MRKIWVTLLALCLLSLLIFSMYGRQLYEMGKPSVSATYPSRWVGQEGIIIPIEALYTIDGTDHIFILKSEDGYSRTIHTVHRLDVEVADFVLDKAVLPPDCGIKAGDKVVIGTTEPLADGMRVIVN